MQALFWVQNMALRAVGADKATVNAQHTCCISDKNTHLFDLPRKQTDAQPLLERGEALEVLPSEIRQSYRRAIHPSFRGLAHFLYNTEGV